MVDKLRLLFLLISYGGSQALVLKGVDERGGLSIS